MAVAETFLRHGQTYDGEIRNMGNYRSPSRTDDGRRDRWELLLVAPPLWGANQHFVIGRPLVMMYFALPDSTDGDDQLTSKACESWRLIRGVDIRHMVKRDKREGVVPPIVDDLEDVLHAVPAAERPSRITVRLVDYTPAGLESTSPFVFSSNANTTTADLIREEAAGLGVDRVEAASVPAESAVPALVTEVIDWMQRREKRPLTPYTTPGWSQLLDKADADRRNSVLQRIAALCTGPLATAHAVLTPADYEAIQNDPRRKPKPMSESIVATALDVAIEGQEALPTEPSAFAPLRGAVVVQRPLAVLVDDPSALPQGTDALEAAQDQNPARGTTPFPHGKGPEVLLFFDNGDALYCTEKLTSPIPTDWVEDMLHTTDGAIVVHIGPPNGANDADSIAVLNAIGKVSTANEASALPVLRAFRRVPTGKSVRRTPVENPHMTTVDTPLPSLEALERVLDAVESVAGTFVPAGDGPHAKPFAAGGLPHRVMVDPKATARGIRLPDGCPECAWCGRRREKLSRCGGCKSVYYCCAAHQAQDWKARHKAECKLIKALAQDKSEVATVIEEGGGVPSEVESNAATISALMGELVDSGAMKKRKSRQSMTVHVVGIPPDAWDSFLDKLAALLNEVGPRKVFACPNVDELRHVRVVLSGTDHTEATATSTVYRGRFANEGVKSSDNKSNASFTVVPSTSIVGDLWNELDMSPPNTAAATVVELPSDDEEEAVAPAEQPAASPPKHADPAAEDNDGELEVSDDDAEGTSQSTKDKQRKANKDGWIGAPWVKLDQKPIEPKYKPKYSAEPLVEDDGTITVTVRTNAERYHHLYSTFEQSRHFAPDAILCVGSRTGEGMSFFTAATEVFVDLCGDVPIAIAEASRLGCHRTLEAIRARHEMASDAPEGTRVVPPPIATWDIRVNRSAVCRVASPVPNAGTGGSAPPASSTHHINSFFTAVVKA